MIRVFLLFMMLSAMFWLVILTVQKLSGQQAWNLTQAAFYAIISASLAVVLMFALVTIF